MDSLSEVMGGKQRVVEMQLIEGTPKHGELLDSYNEYRQQAEEDSTTHWNVDVKLEIMGWEAK